MANSAVFVMQGSVCPCHFVYYFVMRRQIIQIFINHNRYNAYRKQRVRSTKVSIHVPDPLLGIEGVEHVHVLAVAHPPQVQVVVPEPLLGDRSLVLNCASSRITTTFMLLLGQIIRFVLLF